MFGMNERDEKLYYQKHYEQHSVPPYYVDSYKNPGAKKRRYRVWFGDSYKGWVVIGDYAFLKNAKERVRREVENDFKRLPGIQQVHQLETSEEGSGNS